MAELLLVRSGESDSPVTKRLEMSVKELKQELGSRTLHYLGAELPPIGETSRISEFADPDHVVLSVADTEAKQFNLDGEGFYLIEDLSPADYM